MNALYLICGLGIVSLIAEILSMRRWLVAVLTVGLLSAAALITLEWNTNAPYYAGMVVIDNFAVAFTGLICVVAVLWFVMSDDYFHHEKHVTDETALVLFCITGAVILTSFNNMAMLFLGIEILSISLYILAGSNKDSLYSNEASFKYFLMGSFATGFLLMGIALIYGATGSFEVSTIAAFVSSNASNLPVFFHAGVVMVLIGLLFKVSAVPFHFWAPDVYLGSPTVITAFMSTIVKIAAFAALLRLFINGFGPVSDSWMPVVQVVAALTLVVANIAAVYQNNVKRMLAYSSVGHAGYVLLGFLAGGASASAIFYYLGVYAIASLLAFTVLVCVEKKVKNLAVESFGGLFRSSPLLAISMTLALLSLAGIPPLAGFFGKYLVFALALKEGYTGLVVLAVATSVIGVFYYFKVIVAMFTATPVSEKYEVNLSTKIELLILALLVLAAGLFPDAFRFL